MKVEHVFGGHIYLISSYGVARNPLFKEQRDIDVFKENIEKYLGSLCDIYAYSHQYNQFQYLIKIKERSYLEAFYYEKQMAKRDNISHDLYKKDNPVPPDSYMIFSQEVSNCLNSYAKKFNSKYKRRGGLFADRYCKELVEDDDEMLLLIEQLNNLEKKVKFTREWQVMDQATFSDERAEVSSLVIYKEGQKSVKKSGFRNFELWINDNLRGSFECLPPRSMKSPNFFLKYTNFVKIKGMPPPW